MKCEYCGKEHDGSYGKGRFCSAYCARGFSTKAKRKEINKKVSKTLIGRTYAPSLKQKNAVRAMAKANHEAKMKRCVKTRKPHQTTLDITYGELEKYRETHFVCEICGRPEIARSNPNSKRPQKLSIDHDHKTSKFRGLLCYQCNIQLGWYEQQKENIKRYLGE